MKTLVGVKDCSVQSHFVCESLFGRVQQPNENFRVFLVSFNTFMSYISRIALKFKFDFSCSTL